MKDKIKNLAMKIDYLYHKLEDVSQERASKQADFLLDEIDEHKTQLLKIETKDYYQELDNEDD